MLLKELREAKAWSVERRTKDSYFLPRLWSCAGLVAQGQALLLVGVCLLFNEIYDNQLSAIAVITAIAIIAWSLKWIRLPLASFCLYLLLSAVWHFGVDDSMVATLQGAIGTMMGRQTLFLMLLGTNALIFRFEVRLVAPVFLVVASLLSLCHHPVLENLSTNAALICLCLPWAKRWWMWMLCLIVLILTPRGLTAWTMFVTISFLTLAGRMRILALLSLIPPISIWKWTGTGAISYFFFQDRLDEARVALRFFWENVNIWWGGGVGSFLIYGPVAQKLNHEQMKLIWLSVHNDWVQALIELGVVGMALGCWVLIDSLVRAQRDSRNTLILGCLFGLSYFPMEIPIVALFLVTLIVEAQCRE